MFTGFTDKPLADELVGIFRKMRFSGNALDCGTVQAGPEQPARAVWTSLPAGYEQTTLLFVIREGGIFVVPDLPETRNAYVAREQTILENAKIAAFEGCDVKMIVASAFSWLRAEIDNLEIKQIHSSEGPRRPWIGRALVEARHC